MNLSELLKQRKRELGLSYSQMEQAATDAGYPLSRAAFHNIESRPLVNIPNTENIRAIAAAIQLNPDDVLSAAIESIGLGRQDHQKGLRTAAMIAMLANRSPEEQAALEAVLRSAIRLLDTQSEPPPDAAG